MQGAFHTAKNFILRARDRQIQKNSDVFEPIPTSYQVEMSQLLSRSGAVLFSLMMYSKPYLEHATLPCRLEIQAGLKWLWNLKKLEIADNNLVCQKKKPGAPACLVQWVCQEMLGSASHSNSKYEIRSTKQIQNQNSQMFKT
jgi:hypothetical protein